MFGDGILEAFRFEPLLREQSALVPIRTIAEYRDNSMSCVVC